MSQLAEFAVWVYQIAGSRIILLLLPSFVLGFLAIRIEGPILKQIIAGLRGTLDGGTASQAKTAGHPLYERYVARPKEWNGLVNSLEFAALLMRGVFYYSIAGIYSPLVGLGLAMAFLIGEIQMTSRYRVRRLQDRAVRALRATERTRSDTSLSEGVQ